MQHGSVDLKRGSVAMKRSVFKQGCEPALPSAATISTHSVLHSPPDLFEFGKAGGKQKREQRKASDESMESFFEPLQMHTNTSAGLGSEVKWP